jgi:CheY-like chemotaxis protein
MARAQLLRIVLQAAAMAKISDIDKAPTNTSTSDLKPGVLVVDDSELVIDAWEFMLGNDSNLYTMRSFEELQERLSEEPSFLENLSYVVTDMHLDGSQGNGLDVGRLIKSIRPDLPVLMSSDEIFKEHELTGAVDRIIAKMPVGIADLRMLGVLALQKLTDRNIQILNLHIIQYQVNFELEVCDVRSTKENRSNQVRHCWQQWSGIYW